MRAERVRRVVHRARLLTHRRNTNNTSSSSSGATPRRLSALTSLSPPLSLLSVVFVSSFVHVCCSARSYQNPQMLNGDERKRGDGRQGRGRAQYSYAEAAAGACSFFVVVDSLILSMTYVVSPHESSGAARALVAFFVCVFVLGDGVGARDALCLYWWRQRLLSVESPRRRLPAWGAKGKGSSYLLAA